MGKKIKKSLGDGDVGERRVVYTHGKKRSAVASAVTREGHGSISVNGIPIQNIEPRPLRVKVFEPVLVLGAEAFKDLAIRVRVRGGGAVAQLYAARLAISKALVAWNQKFVDEESREKIRKSLILPEGKKGKRLPLPFLRTFSLETL